MKSNYSVVVWLLVLLLSITITACSGGNAPPPGDTAGTSGTTGTADTTDTKNTIGSSGPAHTIVLSTPFKDSVENLGKGFYRRRGALIVTDKFGNLVEDGTKIDLGIIDSVIAEGTTGEIAAAASLVDASPHLSDGTSAGFSEALITRNNTQRSIQQDDWLMITGLLVNAEDKVRNIGNATIESTILPVQTSFLGTKSGLSYVVGASLLGIGIEGKIAETDEWTKDRATTKDGLADVRVTYPAKPETIHVGCGSLPSIDDRHLPLNSARVYTVATAGGGTATMIDDETFCFSSIAGWTLTPSRSAITGNTPVTLTLKDGGDTIRLPLIPISAKISVTADTNTGLVVTATTGLTDIDGKFDSTITIVGGDDTGDAATITFRAGDASTNVTLTIL
ncbi:MAG: hypothetical protein RQ753_08010 [Desulfurivibrionaceae bacterium]|nr:hypothetical protein [Desulfurivibrionaceae bacterium]